MRKVIVLFLGCCLTAFGQQNTPRPKKVLTPEQQEYQRQLKSVWAKRNDLRAKADEAFNREMALEKAGDCPDASNTLEFNQCFDKVLLITNENLKEYEEAIRETLALVYPTMPGTSPHSVGIAGPILTPEQSAAELDQTEQQWGAYRKSACGSVFHQFEGGTGGPSAELECEIRLARNHMRELAGIYDLKLHH